METRTKILKSIVLISLIFTFLISSGKRFEEKKNILNSVMVLSTKTLDANNISTFYRNNGSFNRNPFTSNWGFEWPKGSNKFARYASGLWIGARVGNDTLVSIAEYISGFRPGYTDDNGNPQGENDPLYRVYKLNLGVNDSDRAAWPNILLGNSNQGAPVIFQNNSWRALDFGHQTLFHRYTDSYQQQSLKADVMQLDFAVNLPGGLADVIFSQFTIINRSTSTWNDLYISIWSDDDIGSSYMLDKIGCDSALGLGYTYKSVNSDPSYGNFPPAVGFLMLRGALRYTGNNNDTVYICRNKVRNTLIGYRDVGMSVFRGFLAIEDSCNRDPLNKIQAYRNMSGLDNCGNPMINPVGNYVTRYRYSGNPVTGQGWIQPTAWDQRFIMSTGPVNMNPGDTQVVVVAQLIAQGINNLFSITRLKELCAIVKYYYNTCYTDPVIGGIPAYNIIPKEYFLHQNFPNPFNPATRIRFELPEISYVSVVIYDALGREITRLINNELKKEGIYEITWDASGFPSGVYFCRLIADNFTYTRKMILLK